MAHKKPGWAQLDGRITFGYDAAHGLTYGSLEPGHLLFQGPVMGLRYSEFPWATPFRCLRVDAEVISEEVDVAAAPGAGYGTW